MRKILLATTALIGVAFAGVAQAAAPGASAISLNVGGYDDFVAGYYNGGYASGGANRPVHDDFENEFKISFDAAAKASNGVEYGANVALWNGAEVTNNWIGSGQGVSVNSAYVWMSGAFGKVLFGDEHGASDLFVYAPTVGEGQIDGRFENFVSDTRIAAFSIMPSGFDNTEHSTKITYYTPKVGNDTNKVQLGVSYAPQLYNYGADVVGNSFNTSGIATSNGASAYQDLIKGVAQYTGNFKPVNVTASAQWIHGGGSNKSAGTTILGQGLAFRPIAGGGIGEVKDFNAYGLGGQVGFDGFTLGAGYNSLGDYNTVDGQNRSQASFNVGGKYEFDKVGVALSYIHGRGYDNLLTANALSGATVSGSTNYVNRYNAGGAGATYTWFPGLTSNVDGVVYGQHVADEPGAEGGYTVLVSQRLAF